MERRPRDEPRAADPGARRAALPAIRQTVTTDTISTAVDEAFPELFGWLAATGTAADGPPFIRYLVIDMAADREIELAVPVGAPAAQSGRIQPGALPEGRYAVLQHTGHYDGLAASNAALQHWAREYVAEFAAPSAQQPTTFSPHRKAIRNLQFDHRRAARQATRTAVI